MYKVRFQLVLPVQNHATAHLIRTKDEIVQTVSEMPKSAWFDAVLRSRINRQALPRPRSRVNFRFTTHLPFQPRPLFHAVLTDPLDHDFRYLFLSTVLCRSKSRS